MKVLIRPVSDVKLTIDGQELPGTFTLVSEWEGFAKFMCAEPPGFVVVGFPGQGSVVDLLLELCSRPSPLGFLKAGVEATAVRMSVGIQAEVGKKRVAEPVEPTEPVMEPAAAVPAGPGTAGFCPAGGTYDPVMVGGRRRVG